MAPGKRKSRQSASKPSAWFCRDGVKTFIFQGIRLQLRHQAYPAPFLLFVDQEAGPFRGDRSHRKFQLVAAVATPSWKFRLGRAFRFKTP
jgi:hypothetical protein